MCYPLRSLLFRYVNLKACISRLPENGDGSTPFPWPARLMEPPKRLQGVEMDAYSSKNELFKAETKFWDDIVEGYVRVFKWRKFKFRNVMDMRAGFGGYFFFFKALSSYSLHSLYLPFQTSTQCLIHTCDHYILESAKNIMTWRYFLRQIY